MSARYEIIGCEQGTPEWHQARLGMPTASRFKDIMAQGAGKMRDRYMKQLAGEIITREPMSTYTNEKMERGKEHEPDLRLRYIWEKEVDVEEVGFIKMNPELCRTGCSPDGLVGEGGMVEIKSAEPPVLIDVLRSKQPPTEHLAQIQGQLWITGRRWCDLVIGWPKMPLFITRVVWADTYIGPLSVAVKAFNVELDKLVKEIKTK